MYYRFLLKDLKGEASVPRTRVHGEHPRACNRARSIDRSEIKNFNQSSRLPADNRVGFEKFPRSSLRAGRGVTYIAVSDIDHRGDIESHSRTTPSVEIGRLRVHWLVALRLHRRTHESRANRGT